jgi:hypothetical protein
MIIVLSFAFFGHWLSLELTLTLSRLRGEGVIDISITDTSLNRVFRAILHDHPITLDYVLATAHGHTERDATPRFPKGAN